MAISRLGALILGAVSIAGFAASGCKARKEDAAASSEVLGSVPLSSTPPSTVFHFGEYKYLAPLKVRNGTYSANEWIQMPSTRYTAYRAGLYTSQHPAYNERYVAGNLDDPRSNGAWMMVLQLKDECLSNAAPPISDILSSSSFDAYVRRTNYRSASTYQQYCPEATVFSAIPENNTRSDGCAQIMNGYFSQQGYKIYSDHFWPGYGYWIVHDRSCIAQIDATPAGILHALADVPELWNMAPYQNWIPRDKGYPEGWAGYPLVMIVVRALDEAPTWDSGDLQALRAKAEKSDMYPIGSQVIAIIDAAQRCLGQNNLASFKAQSKFFIDKAGDTTYLASLGFQKHVENFVAYGLRKACP